MHTYTEADELICDPFCGSGTTGIAAQELGRRFHGIETNPAYCELARRRITVYGCHVDVDVDVDSSKPTSASHTQ